MGAKQSAEMIKAREYVERGMRPAEAARLCKLTPQAIYRTDWYKELRDANRKNVD